MYLVFFHCAHTYLLKLRCRNRVLDVSCIYYTEAPQHHYNTVDKTDHGVAVFWCHQQIAIPPKQVIFHKN